MAELHNEPYPMPSRDEYDDYQDYYEAEKEALDEVMKNEDVIKFHVADGYAYYRVVDMHEPVLQHIPFGDAYRIPAAHIRGLRTEDIKQKL